MAKEAALDEILNGKDFEEAITKLSFEQGLKMLEELVVKVESGSLALDKAIGAYERGVCLIERLKSHLSGAEEKLKCLQKPQ